LDITYTRGLSSPRMESHETILVGSPVVGTDSTAAVDPRLQVDLGCNFFCQAEVADPTMICVGIGYGFFVELTLDEATVSATRPRHPSSPHEHPSPSIMLHPSSVVWTPCDLEPRTQLARLMVLPSPDVLRLLLRNEYLSSRPVQRTRRRLQQRSKLGSRLCSKVCGNYKAWTLSVRPPTTPVETFNGANGLDSQSGKGIR
jgi:hypothetical protein